MTRYLMLLFVLFAAAFAQPETPPVEPAATPAPALQPAIPAAPDTAQRLPLFRPKVVIRRDVVIPKDPFLGGALSLVLPGTGQAYSGKWLKGVGFLGGVLLGYGLGSGMNQDITKREAAGDAVKTGEKTIAGVTVLIGLGLHVWSVLDGINTANAHNRLLLEDQ